VGFTIKSLDGQAVGGAGLGVGIQRFGCGLMADTRRRFNVTAGLPRYAVADMPQPGGTIWRIGTAQCFGLTLRWEEGVPDGLWGRVSHTSGISAPGRSAAPCAKSRSARPRVVAHASGIGFDRAARAAFVDSPAVRCSRPNRSDDRSSVPPRRRSRPSRENAFGSEPPVIAASIRQTVAIRARTLFRAKAAGSLLSSPK
jgi:hypothetical protein